MEVRGANRFVRFLRVADLGLILALVVILGAVQLLHRGGRFAQRLLAQRGRVGSVIRDHAFEIAAAKVHALEQPLRDLHRPLGREPELAVRFLLQRRGRKRRRGTLRERFLFDARDRPRQAAHQGLAQRLRVLLAEQPHRVRFELALAVEVLAGRDALAADLGERRAELHRAAAQLRFEIPVARGREREAFFLALDDDSHRHALHAARAESGLDFLPQHRRQRVAVEAIENAPALLGAHEVLVDVVRVGERRLHRFFRDLVKDDAADLDLGLEQLLEVPADRLAFAIGVGRENQFRRIFHRGLERRDVLLLVGGDDVIGREVAVGVDAHPAPRLAFDLGRDFGGGLGQIADVTVARLDPVLATEEAGQGSGLGGRLDYD